MNTTYVEIVKEAVETIDFKGSLINIKPFGDGHINDTFLLEYKLCNGERIKYILQRINHHIFNNVGNLMENYCNICSYLKEEIISKGGDEKRQAITVIHTKDGKSFMQDSMGNYWRGILFIENSLTMEVIESSTDFYKTGMAFGKFHAQLENFKVEKLHEIIPNFHNTKERYESFVKAVENDKANRVELVKKEIDFIINRKADTTILLDMLSRGELPQRVTHNDAKLSNIILDRDTKEGICIIDLDTVMPGLVAYDFGDAIRSGATYAKEDEEDLNKVEIELNLFEAFSKGFIEGADGKLTEKEIATLPLGAKIITLEQGIRFLTDYINGDIYYKISYPEQNLYRTRTQLKLVSDMELKWNELNEIIKKYN